MNFITWQGPATELELKYCERCGGLWLRLHGDTEVYCAACRRQMTAFPHPSAGRSSNPRLPHPDRDDIECQYELKSLQGVIEVEVRP